MRISDLQTKDVINQGDGRNIGRIIDIVEPKKIMKKLNIYNSETNINIKQIVKIGEDVILVDLR